MKMQGGTEKHGKALKNRERETQRRKHREKMNGGRDTGLSWQKSNAFLEAGQVRGQAEREKAGTCRETRRHLGKGGRGGPGRARENTTHCSAWHGQETLAALALSSLPQ